MLSLKVSNSPKYLEVALDFAHYVTGVFYPESLAANRSAENASPRASVLHVIWHAKVNEVGFSVLRGEGHALVVTKFTLQFSAVYLSPSFVRQNSPRRRAERI